MRIKSDWQARFGAKRRAIDRAILAECERRIALEEQTRREETQRIAKAFGRPLN